MYLNNIIHKKIPHRFSSLLLLCLLNFALGESYASEITLNTTGSTPLITPEQTGFMDLVAIEAFKRINMTLKTVKLPAERGLRNANAGIIDGEMSRIADVAKIYPNLICTQEKIMTWEFFAFSQKSINMDKGWSSLLPYSVSFLNGWKILEKNVPKEVELTKVRTINQLFSILDKKRTDIILYERWAALSYIKNKNLQSIHLLKPKLAKTDLFICLHKKHRRLIVKLTNALKTMKQDGSYNNIIKKILTPLE